MRNLAASFLFAIAAFAEETKPPLQFTDAQKLTIAQAALRASIAGQARQATEQANQIIAQAKAENEKYAALVAKMLADAKLPADCTVDIAQAVTCPSPKK
jgi:rubrerythrin